MLKVVLLDGRQIDIPDGATVVLDTTGSDQNAKMVAKITVPNVSGLIVMKPGEEIAPPVPKRQGPPR